MDIIKEHMITDIWTFELDAYYERAYHYEHVKKLDPCDENCARGAHLNLT